MQTVQIENVVVPWQDRSVDYLDGARLCSVTDNHFLVECANGTVARDVSELLVHVDSVLATEVTLIPMFETKI